MRAFKKARDIRRLVSEGLDVARDVRELNQLGKLKGAPDLGDRALADAAAQRRSKPPAPPETTPVTQGDKPPITSDMPPVTQGEKPPVTQEKPKPTQEKPPATSPKRPAATPPRPASVKATTLGFRNREHVRSAVVDGLSGLKSGMEKAQFPKDYLKMTEVLAAMGKDKEIAEIAKVVPEVMGALRDPKLYGEVMAEAWVRAVNSDTGVNAALLHMASDVGMTTKVIPASMGEIPGSVFFNRYAGKPVSIVDKPLGGGNPHGSMMHLVQDRLGHATVGGHPDRHLFHQPGARLGGWREDRPAGAHTKQC